MLNENRIDFETLGRPLEVVIATYEAGDKSKKITMGLYLDPKTSKLDGYKFFVYQGTNTVLSVEHLRMAIDRYNAIKIEPEVVIPAVDGSEQDHGTFAIEVP